MNLKPLLVIPPVVLGILGYVWMTQPDETPAEPQVVSQQAVRIITVAEDPITVTARGFGRVAAVRSWSAVSQVEGRVTKTHLDLATGTIAEDGVLLVQVDPTDYELAIDKSEANIQAAKAALSELEKQEANSRRLLELEQRILKVTQAEYDRIETLFKSGTTTNAALDTVQKTLLAGENSLLTLTNSIELYPAQRASAEATLAVRQAELAEAKRGLANTIIKAPFRGRVSEQAVQVGQFIRTGEELVVLEAVDEVEVVGAFQPQAFGSMIRASLGQELQSINIFDVTQIVEFMKQVGVSAYLEYDFSGGKARYPADINRFRGGIDSDTGTLGVVVRVKDPLVIKTGQNRPPLDIGRFVSVVLEAHPKNGAITVPRAVIQQDDDGKPFVYTADADDKLAISPVTPGAVVGDRIIIQDGLNVGDRVLLSTPQPAIVGLALTPVLDGGDDT